MENQPAPNFEVAATNGQLVRFNDYLGCGVVLYFYPKDDTPGCTIEARDFAALHGEFKAAGWEILGVSRDSVKSHERFCAKYSLPFTLLADEDERVCELYGVMKLKNMYGKQVRGIERSTFVVTPAGQIARVWRGVKVPDHAREVLEFVRSLA